MGLNKSFDLRDFLLISRLQNQGRLLSLEEALTQPYRPLLAALLGYLPVQGVGVLTCVYDAREDNQQTAGFAQVRLRRDGSEADVIYLSAEQEGFTTWCRLLENLCLEAGERGIQRIFARLPEDGPEVEAFQQVGFTTYAREDILRLTQMPSDLPRPENQTLRRQQPADNWGLHGLYASITPRLVQQAENLTARDWEITPGPWPGQSRRDGYVLKDQEEIVGYLRIRQGRTGHWLEMLLHPQAYERAEEFVEQSLLLLAEYPPCPIYCCLRRYQGGLRAPLETRGFEPFASQCVMVKHTTIRIKEPTLRLVPALETRAEAATPMMKTHEVN